jgi:NitT/TauT family transport system substrate-binding protein/sulfonate transport system substrate-binding protein
VVRATARPSYIPEEIFAPLGILLPTGTERFLVEQRKIREDFGLEEWFHRPPDRPAQG